MFLCVSLTLTISCCLDEQDTVWFELVSQFESFEPGAPRSCLDHKTIQYAKSCSFPWLETPYWLNLPAMHNTQLISLILTRQVTPGRWTTVHPEGAVWTIPPPPQVWTKPKWSLEPKNQSPFWRVLKEIIFWLNMPASTMQIRNSEGIFVYMHHFSLLASMCFVAWSDNMKVASHCSYVSLAANSPCIPGLKVQKLMELFSFSKNKTLWKETTGMLFFPGGLESFSFPLFPWDVDLKGYNLEQRLSKL